MWAKLSLSLPSKFKIVKDFFFNLKFFFNFNTLFIQSFIHFFVCVKGQSVGTVAECLSAGNSSQIEGFQRNLKVLKCYAGFLCCFSIFIHFRCQIVAEGCMCCSLLLLAEE